MLPLVPSAFFLFRFGFILPLFHSRLGRFRHGFIDRNRIGNTGQAFEPVPELATDAADFDVHVGVCPYGGINICIPIGCG